MSDYIDRLIFEKRELDAKLTSLNNFRRSAVFDGLQKEEQMDMNSQSYYMEQYSDILNDRINRAKERENV